MEKTAEHAPLCVGAREAARMLSISERTLWTMEQRGEIKSVRFGGERRQTVRYRISDLQAWLESRAEASTGREA